MSNFETQGEGDINTKHNKSTALDELIENVTLHVRKPTWLSGLVLPFIPLYALSVYFLCCGHNGALIELDDVDDSKEQKNVPWNDAGIIGLVAITFLHILTMLCSYWSVHVLTFLTCERVKEPADGVLAKVVPTANNGNSKIVPVKSIKLDALNGELQYYFLFQKTKYIWDVNKAMFRNVEFPVNELLSTYARSSGLVTDNDIKFATQTYGNNEMEMVVPEFHELFTERATAPFFVFQVFSVGLWCLDEYWYYSLFTLFMLIVFECTIVKQQLRNMSEIRKMGNKPYLIYARRLNKWRHIGTDELVPGDLVSIKRSQDDLIVPCDMVLLRGNCIVDESMLTGESVPLMKESLETLDQLNIELDAEGSGKLFMLFGGTKVVQHTPPTNEALRAPDNGCIAYVIRTGFNTSQGKLLRTILFGANRATENNMDTFAFILFLMIFAIAAAVYVWVKGTEDPKRSRYKLFLECALIVTSIIPPDLPIELTLAVNSSLMQLTKLFVFCTEPFRIPFAGKVQICCFDKTGTLTTDNLTVEGIAGTMPNVNEAIPIEEANDNTIKVLATCHSLTLLDDELVGDPLEKVTLSAIDWHLTKKNSVIARRSQLKPMRIHTRFHFSSALKRMSSVAGHLVPYSNDIFYIGTVKGAPEIIKGMLINVPKNYDEIYKEHASHGARVLALGIKEFGVLSMDVLNRLTRDDVEANLTFAGFLIISCPMKPDSKVVIKELIKSSHKVIIITGDNPLTACHVAHELRFTRKKMLVLTSPEPNGDNENWKWENHDGTAYEADFKNSQHIDELFKNNDLCITGEGLHYLQRNEYNFLLYLLPRVTVFARFAPKQKEYVIITLKQLGYYTLMCGDGTNDVGALKHAHVGVALLTSGPVVKRKRENDRPSPFRDLAEEDQQTFVQLGDASIAAPFTSKSTSIKCVNHIIKQGRCTLVTTLQMFKILALNALINAYCQSVLYIDGVKFSDCQATVQGIFIAACFLFITRSKPLKTLSKEAPLANIFNWYTISTILGQFSVHFFALFYLSKCANELSPVSNEAIKLYTDLTEEEKIKYEPNILSSTVYLICLSLQVATIAVNYKGQPFMEGLRMNRMLSCSIAASATLVVVLAGGLSASLSAFLEIIDFPFDFRLKILGVLILDIVGSFAIDRLFSYILGDTRRRSDVLKC